MNKLIAGLLLLSLCGCKDCEPQQQSVNDDFAEVARIHPVCIEGHVYYHGSIMLGGNLLAPKLTDDGKPVLCGPLVEKGDSNVNGVQVPAPIPAQ